MTEWKKFKAMGLNTLTTYVFWNVHETSPGKFDVSGQNDLAEYLREADQEGLNVILRPGPYICAEWELGGYPAWLLKDHTMLLRSRDPRLMAVVHAWFTKLGQVVRPFMGSQGGPILAVQVENEYGSFGGDHQYMEDIRRNSRPVVWETATCTRRTALTISEAGHFPNCRSPSTSAPGRSKRHLEPPPPPTEVPATAYLMEPAAESASLWANLPAPTRSEEPLSMEDIDQSYGYILYTTKLQPHEAATLRMDAVHDYASVYLDHNLIGVADRRLGQSSVALPRHHHSRRAGDTG